MQLQIWSFLRSLYIAQLQSGSCVLGQTYLKYIYIHIYIYISIILQIPYLLFGHISFQNVQNKFKVIIKYVLSTQCCMHIWDWPGCQVYCLWVLWAIFDSALRESQYRINIPLSNIGTHWSIFHYLVSFEYDDYLNRYGDSHYKNKTFMRWQLIVFIKATLGM